MFYEFKYQNALQISIKGDFDLTCHFSLNQTISFYEEFLFSIFFGLYITTTQSTPLATPRGYCNFKHSTAGHKTKYTFTIVILIIFTYMGANEVLWNIFWVEDISWPLRPKTWPKKGQNFKRQKFFNFSH